jgi:hypothetical protein
VELVPAIDIEERELLKMLDHLEEVTEEQYTKACDDLGIKPSYSDVGFSCGCVEDPPTAHGRALYTYNRISSIVLHLWEWKGVLDEDLLYSTINGVRYLVGIDLCADNLRLLKATGFLPQRPGPHSEDGPGAGLTRETAAQIAVRIDDEASMLVAQLDHRAPAWAKTPTGRSTAAIHARDAQTAEVLLDILERPEGRSMGKIRAVVADLKAATEKA